MSTDLVAPRASFSLNPTNIDEALRFAEMLSHSEMVPKQFIGKPGNILVAIQWGMELGLQPMQAMQNIAVINGRPSLWGDAVLALVTSSPVCEDVVEYYDGTPGSDDYTAVCIAKRKGRADKMATFSIADAKLANLLGKDGPWKQYRDRMMKMRARSFALRDQFADVLKGMPMAEEVRDMVDEDGATTRTTTAAASRPAISGPAPYPEADFAKNLPTWGKAIADNRITIDGVVAKVKAKGALTEDQIKRLKEYAAPIEGETTTITTEAAA